MEFKYMQVGDHFYGDHAEFMKKAKSEVEVNDELNFKRNSTLAKDGLKEDKNTET